MKNFVEMCKRRPSAGTIVVLTVLALFFNFFASDLLNNSYAESQFPVPYYEAQLSFDPAKLKAWYSFLLERNTLSKYVQTQHVDFLFIVSTLFLHFFALLLVSRMFPASSRWRTALVVCAMVSSLAPISDAMENAVSYVMLADPLHFSSFLAYVYSAFAAIKFSMFVFFYVAVAVGLAAALVLMTHNLIRRRATMAR